MEQLQDFGDDQFDFVYSSLTMHYAGEWVAILKEIKRVMTKDAHFLFSTHHPVKWGSQVDRGEQQDSYQMGYVRPKTGMPTVHGDYLGSREIRDVWFGNQEVTYFHRPLSALFRDIRESGMLVRDFIEPMPVPEALFKNPAFHAMHSKIPLFMIFDLTK